MAKPGKLKLWLYRWLMPVIRWFAFAALSAMAVANAATDHGVLMAINCFFLGFMFCSLLLGKLMDRRIKEIDVLFADLKSAQAYAEAAFAKFTKAINDGYVEVIPMTMPDDTRPPTRH